MYRHAQHVLTVTLIFTCNKTVLGISVYGINNVLQFIERKKIYLIIHNCTLNFIQNKDDKQKSKSSYY